MRSAVLFGGYGVFGKHVARALAAAGVRLRIAGRDAARAAGFASRLGDGHEGVAADVQDPASCARAVEGMRVAVNCAGPFSAMNLALPEACLAAGAHYVDIADDRGWFARMRDLGGRFHGRGLAAACGCSALPGISGALALAAAERLPEVHRARITLFIGNRNPKGEAAVASAAAQLGRPFQAPQGRLTGFRGRELVTLPPPFGRRAVYDFDSPELDLFPQLIGAREVRVKVGFESRLATGTFAALSYLGPAAGLRLAGAAAPLARRLSGLGHSGGCVVVELFGSGIHAASSLGAPEEGQRMAALPAAFVAQGLLDGTVTARGAVTAYETLGARPLLEKLTAAGFRLGVEG